MLYSITVDLEIPPRLMTRSWKRSISSTLPCLHVWDCPKTPNRGS